MYMDFDQEMMASCNHGNYIPMEVSLMPPLWLAYVSDPSDSGEQSHDSHMIAM